MLNDVIYHTADIGMKENAKNLTALFKKCAEKIKKLILKKNRTDVKSKKTTLFIKSNENSFEELLHDFLNEIIYFILVRKRYPVKIKIVNISNVRLKADVFYRKIRKNEIIRELKSVTYHNLKIEKNKNGYEATFVIDT
jgi:SHS2 domain-containing protein